MTKAKKILVIEDDFGSREYLAYLLKDAGYEVESAESGELALEILLSSHPDLVISDILMPGMDGFELVQRLRTKRSLANVPVLFYSATYHQAEAEGLMGKAGLAQRLEKPAEPKVILKAVEDALNQPHAHGSFDSSAFSEDHLRVVSEKLIQKMQALTAANQKLEESRVELEAEMHSRKKLEEELRESESRLRQITSCAPVGIYQANPLGECLFVNEWWISITGLPLQECLGWGWIQAVHPADRDVVVTAVKKAMAEEGVYQGEFRILTSSQQTRSVISHAVPVRGLDGGISGYVGMLLDVTERKQLEDQLRQSQKMEAVGQLAAGVAHDFNNLLAIIMGNTELALLRIEETNPIARKLQDVKSATDKAARLIRQLLMFSRQEINEPRKIDLNPAISVSSRFLRRLIGENISIRLLLTDEPATVTIDPGHLEQVLMNMIINARDAMPHGGTVTIETSVADLRSESLEPGFTPQPGSYALLAVSDTGTGMDAATKSHIFEPFFTTKEKGKGTGLGLATVEGIIKQAGGQIAVYSEVDRGTTFKIFLPLSSAAAEPQIQAERELVPGESETVLLVEDETALRTTVRECLLESGYKVLEAGDGVEAIAIADQHKGKIDLLLTDIVMPRMGSTNLVNYIATKYPATQVLLMTGYTEDFAIRQGMLRAPRVIQKPFTRHSLLQKIRTVLDAAKPSSRKHTILLAEDDPSYRELIVDTLQSSGFEVLSSQSGTRALLHGFPNKIDLAILDVLVPRASSFSVCRKLRSNPKTAKMPIIVISGLTTKDDQRLALEAGASMFLRKPFSTDELLSSIKTLLVSQQTGSENLPPRL